MSNAAQFLDHYSAIEKYLRRTYALNGQFESFLQLITKAEKNHSIVRFYAADLREYGELRNAIVHNRSPQANTVIAEPHSFVVERTAHIREMIEHPVKVSHVMTQPVFTTTSDSLLYPTAELMLTQLYTHVPIYKENKLIGVLSETAILRWVGHRVRDNKQLIQNRKIEDIIQWLDQPGNRYNDYGFVHQNMSVLDARRRFETALNDGQRLGALFVTKSGKVTEPILGIITAWDMPKLQLV